jgi:hypothetical protein
MILRYGHPHNILKALSTVAMHPTNFIERDLEKKPETACNPLHKHLANSSIVSGPGCCRGPTLLLLQSLICKGKQIKLSKSLKAKLVPQDQSGA